MDTGKLCHENTFQIIHLLNRILDQFQDGECRPASQIALYEKYRELRRTHATRLIRHLIVIDGGANRTADASRVMPGQ